jgi:putative hemolysin
MRASPVDLSSSAAPPPQDAPATKRLGRYAVRLARNADELIMAQRLRYVVFNLELGEGLAESVASGLDIDRYDAACDHLLVIDTSTRPSTDSEASARETSEGLIVGTYRLQTGLQAAQHHGYYCEREFDFTPYQPFRHEMLELGRACIDVDHRNFTVLASLWRGISDYGRAKGSRYLLGCSSLTSQSEAEGAAAYMRLQKHMVAPTLRTVPHPAFACNLGELAQPAPKIPRLLSSYLSLGCKIAGPPAIDREFKTIDFLTIFDLEQIRLDGKSGWLRFERG